MKRQIGIKLDEELLQRIDAAKNGSRTKFIEEALEARLRNPAEDAVALAHAVPSQSVPAVSKALGIEPPTFSPEVAAAAEAQNPKPSDPKDAEYQARLSDLRAEQPKRPAAILRGIARREVYGE
jgi:hypothetical protein